MIGSISVSRLSKVYKLGADRNVRDTLRETISSGFSFLRSNVRRRENFWALDDVSFDVSPGEVVGVIGRNGAGKSTLLKVLSRVTEPTHGEVRMRGRVGSLLEIGTGFHPELTGRENIFMSGAALGMRRSEISRKFDQIVDFAGVEKFLDTPIKRYSSGMSVRLGFAVAAHLEPEILLVDEVLAVGDAAFQAKCLGRIAETVGGGRTVIFVSHNMAAVSQICSRCILLETGKVASDGPVNDVLRRYFSRPDDASAVEEFPFDPNKKVQIRRMFALNESGDATQVIDWASSFEIVIEIEASESVSGSMTLCVFNIEGLAVTESNSADSLQRYTVFEPGERKQFKLSFPRGAFNVGRFFLRVWLDTENDANLDWKESFPVSIESISGIEKFTGRRKPPRGSVVLQPVWQEMPR